MKMLSEVKRKHAHTEGERVRAKAEDSERVLLQ